MPDDSERDKIHPAEHGVLRAPTVERHARLQDQLLGFYGEDAEFMAELEKLYRTIGGSPAGGPHESDLRAFSQRFGLDRLRCEPDNPMRPWGELAVVNWLMYRDLRQPGALPFPVGPSMGFVWAFGEVTGPAPPGSLSRDGLRREPLVHVAAIEGQWHPSLESRQEARVRLLAQSRALIDDELDRIEVEAEAIGLEADTVTVNEGRDLHWLFLRIRHDLPWQALVDLVDRGRSPLAEPLDPSTARHAVERIAPDANVDIGRRVPWR